MQFLIVEKLSDGTDYVVLGPMNWRPSFFTSCLRDDLEINFNVPMTCPEKAIFITDNVKIVPVRDTIITDSYNEKIQELQGPFYTFFEDYVEIRYKPVDKPIEIIKDNLKKQIASNRYKYETKGIEVSLNGSIINITTSRNEREIFLQAYQLGKDNINWKFGESFLTLSNQDLKVIVDSISSHVQSTFDWEKLKQEEIDSKTTTKDLDNVSLISDNFNWEPSLEQNS